MRLFFLLPVRVGFASLISFVLTKSVFDKGLGTENDVPVKSSLIVDNQCKTYHCMALIKQVFLNSIYG